jgi:hypothetical protein
MERQMRHEGMLIGAALVWAAACSGSGESGVTASGAGASGAAGGESSLSGLSGGAAPGATGAGGACAATSTQAQLRPVYLAMAFDVSASMGKLDKPYHDPALKWEPVVAATTTFCADPQSSGIHASMTFFPIDGGTDARCAAGSYGAPDVPMTKLPSGDFATAIQAVTPASPAGWRSGTPTLAVVQGSFAQVAAIQPADAAGRYALVLITDGYPQGCDDDSISSVVDAVSPMAASIPTYVIGLTNPPPGPDTVSNLDAIAAAGGTQQAFLIATGDPAATAQQFSAAIAAIAQTQISCEIVIPPPPQGEMFVPGKINVSSSSGSVTTTFVYDETCAVPDAWHYDDPANPSTIVLCSESCAAVQADPLAVLHVEFGCDTTAVAK